MKDSWKKINSQRFFYLFYLLKQEHEIGTRGIVDRVLMNNYKYVSFVRILIFTETLLRILNKDVIKNMPEKAFHEESNC